jgi:hypothetical protein
MDRAPSGGVPLGAGGPSFLGKTMGICVFCGKPQKLIKAHIIPEGFFRRLRKTDVSLKQFEGGKYPKRAYLGVYDQEILCAECEKRFGDWDNYSQKILIEDTQSTPLLERQELSVGYNLGPYDYSKLKLFFISMVWRASVSKQKFFSRVSLGPFEQRARQLIENNNPSTQDDFSVCVSVFNSNALGANGFLDPYTTHVDGVKYVCFYLGVYFASIKVDQRRAPPSLQCFELHPNSDLLMWETNFSLHQENMKKVLLSSKRSNVPRLKCHSHSV